MELIMIKLKAHQNNQGKKKMDPPNSLVIRIIILFEWRMETFLIFSMATRIFILTIIGQWNHPHFPLVHEKK
jgi:hypothetical protein